MASQWHPGPPPAPGAWRFRWTVRTSRQSGLFVFVHQAHAFDLELVKQIQRGASIGTTVGDGQCGIAVWIDQFAVCLPAICAAQARIAFGWRQFGACWPTWRPISLSTIRKRFRKPSRAAADPIDSKNDSGVVMASSDSAGLRTVRSLKLAASLFADMPKVL